MNKLLATFLLLLFVHTAHGQRPTTGFRDNNPMLSPEESTWLNKHFGSAGFDYAGKCVGFAAVSGRGWTNIGKTTWPMLKKWLSGLDTVKLSYTLFVLDSVERTKTRGYDAILVLAEEKNINKLKRTSKNSVLSVSENRYPRLPAKDGGDTSAALNIDTDAYLNAIYAASPNKGIVQPEKPFDFSNKKVAVFKVLHKDHRMVASRIGLAQYIVHIEQKLAEEGYCYTDYTYLLTEEEKKQSGGYDVIIEYPQQKKNFGAGYLIRQLGSSSK